MASSTNINKLCVGRTKASQYFFRKPETRKNRKLWDSLRNISDHFRMYQSQALTVDVMKEEVMEAERRLNEMEMNLEDLVSKAGVTYTMMLNPGASSDKLFKGTDSESVEFRKEMSMNCRIIKYIYCTDNILDSDDKDVLSCTKDCLALDDRISETTLKAPTKTLNQELHRADKHRTRWTLRNNLTNHHLKDQNT